MRFTTEMRVLAAMELIRRARKHIEGDRRTTAIIDLVEAEAHLSLALPAKPLPSPVQAAE